jgi:hypothetical protein
MKEPNRVVDTGIILLLVAALGAAVAFPKSYFSRAMFALMLVIFVLVPTVVGALYAFSDKDYTAWMVSRFGKWPTIIGAAFTALWFLVMMALAIGAALERRW